MKMCNRGVRGVATLTAVAVATSALVPMQAAHADKEKTYKTGAIALGALGAVLAVKGKTVPAVIAGAGAYYAYKKSQDADNERSAGNVYPDSTRTTRRSESIRTEGRRTQTRRTQTRRTDSTRNDVYSDDFPAQYPADDDRADNDVYTDVDADSDVYSDADIYAGSDVYPNDPGYIGFNKKSDSASSGANSRNHSRIVLK
ncbi:MAG TPA: hypothetical protein VF600_15075 [Abditibacteriaceae bacterium]|jgi:hypothetical protein